MFHVERVPRVTNLNPHFDAKIIILLAGAKNDFLLIQFVNDQKFAVLPVEFPETYWVSPLQELWAIPQRCHMLKQGSSLEGRTIEG